VGHFYIVRADFIPARLLLSPRALHSALYFKLFLRFAAASASHAAAAPPLTAPIEWPSSDPTLACPPCHHAHRPSGHHRPTPIGTARHHPSPPAARPLGGPMTAAILHVTDRRRPALCRPAPTRCRSRPVSPAARP
jgi:hypothetical protein